MTADQGRAARSAEEDDAGRETTCWCGQPDDRERVHRAQECVPWVQREKSAGRENATSTSGQEAPMTEPSCPNCGESPMFRSVVHDCCVAVERMRAALTRIANEDYRGNRPWSAQIAQEALDG